MGFVVVNRGGVFEVQRDGQVLFQGLNGARVLELTESQDKDLARVCSVALGLVAPKPAKATKTDDKPVASKDNGEPDSADEPAAPEGDEPVKTDKTEKPVKADKASKSAASASAPK